MLTEYILSILFDVNVALWLGTIGCAVLVIIMAICIAEHNCEEDRERFRPWRNKAMVLCAMLSIVNAMVPTAEELVDAYKQSCEMSGECRAPVKK